MKMTFYFNPFTATDEITHGKIPSQIVNYTKSNSFVRIIVAIFRFLAGISLQYGNFLF